MLAYPKTIPIPILSSMKSVFILLIISFLTPASSSPPHLKYDSIFSFGDSLADTGNLLLSGARTFPFIAKLPYGQTFFHYPTGRCSDGPLIVDFIAEAYGLPYLPPYLAVARGEKFEHGVNFAVAGATALDAKFFYDRNIGSQLLLTNDSLSVQLGWFRKLKSTLICSTKQDCAGRFQKSLFLVGEIGGNDYNYPFFAGGTIQQLKALVPLVVETIANATSDSGTGHWWPAVGGGGPYNFNNSAMCGSPGSKTCSDPTTYANWDGIHLTDSAYRVIAMGLVNGPFTTPPLTIPPIKPF